MGRYFSFWWLLLFLGVGSSCQWQGKENEPPLTALPTVTVSGETVIAPTKTATVVPASSPSPLPSPSPFPSASPALPSSDLRLETVYFYPSPPLYAGDTVTFQIFAHVPDLLARTEIKVEVWIDENLVSSGNLGSSNLAGDRIGLFPWAWGETTIAGNYQARIVLDPQDLIQVGDEDKTNNELLQTIMVHPAEEMPAYLANAAWITVKTSCCRVHVVSGTAAHRDLHTLLPLIDNSFAAAAQKLKETPADIYELYLIDRVIGQGGYASGTMMVVSYLDRAYAGTGLAEVLTHEATHAIDSQFAPRRITFLAEGVAVWATGGHYKPEPLTERTAALLEIGQYIPLTDLINNFYPTQHEIGYLQAGGFVTYLIDTYGWEKVKPFYADVSTDGTTSPAQAIDLSLQKHFNITLADLETEWLAHLARLRPTNAQVNDLLTTIRYYNVIRSYQITYDPTAHFLTAWLPSARQALEQGFTSDLTRHPQSEINIALEAMLVAADQALRAGDYTRSNGILDSVERVLEHDGAFLDPLANHYLNIVRTVTGQGYDVQTIVIEDNQATVYANRSTNRQLIRLTLSLNNNNLWILTQ